MPNFTLLQSNKDIFVFGSQASNRSLSQLTPIHLSQDNSLSGSSPGMFQLDLPRSSSLNRYQLPSDLINGSSVGKHSPQFEDHGEFQPFAVDELDIFPSIEIEFDDEGNLVGILDHEEPQLPTLPGNIENQPTTEQENIGIDGESGEQIVYHSTNDNAVILGEPVLPDADLVHAMTTNNAAERATSENDQDGQPQTVSAQNKKGRKVKLLEADREGINMGRAVFRTWDQDYVSIMEASRKPTKENTRGQAKKLAENLIYNTGLGGAGLPHMLYKWANPLSEDFAGLGLKSSLLGIDASEIAGKDSKKGRRRKSDEAFEDNEEGEQRRTRQRTEKDPELGRGLTQSQGDQALHVDDSMMEVGVDNVAPMEDKHSSSIMPWSRGGSAVPGSAIRGAPGSAHKGSIVPSPQFDRGSAIDSIERRSDVPHIPTSDGFAPFQGPGGLDGIDEAPFTLKDDLIGAEAAAGLNVTNNDFLGYAMQVAEDVGISLPESDETVRWVGFEQLANPKTHDRSVAAQAFLHVLSLATRNAISVRQHGTKEHRPFGKIEIGVDLGSFDTVGMDEDELA